MFYYDYNIRVCGIVESDKWYINTCMFHWYAFRRKNSDSQYSHILTRYIVIFKMIPSCTRENEPCLRLFYMAGKSSHLNVDSNQDYNEPQFTIFMTGESTLTRALSLPLKRCYSHECYFLCSGIIQNSKLSDRTYICTPINNKINARFYSIPSQKEMFRNENQTNNICSI